MHRFPINLRRVAVFIGILFLILVIMDFNDRLDNLNRLQKQDGVLQAQATQGMQTHTALEAQATYAASDQAVQEWARTRRRLCPTWRSNRITGWVNERRTCSAVRTHSFANSHAELANLVESILWQSINPRPS